MDLPKSIYPVWDRCIYCGSFPQAGRRLGNEHIIPLALGGSWELKEASCKTCERITSAIEKKVADHLVTPIREHLGLRGRKQNAPRSLMPLTVVRNCKNERIRVATADHPGTILSWKFDLPTAFTGEPIEANIAAQVVIRTLHPDFARRSAEVGGQINLIDRKPVAPISLARMLAKIAHSYAMAKIGPTGFTPLLNRVILGEEPFYPARFIGGDGVRKDKDVFTRHAVSMTWTPRIDGKLFLVVTIRLFGDLGLPTYQVVTGEMPNDPSPYLPDDVHPIARLRLSGILRADGQIDQPNPVPLSNRGVLTSNGDVPRVFQSLNVPHRKFPPKGGK